MNRKKILLMGGPAHDMTLDIPEDKNQVELTTYDGRRIHYHRYNMRGHLPGPEGAARWSFMFAGTFGNSIGAMAYVDKLD